MTRLNQPPAAATVWHTHGPRSRCMRCDRVIPDGTPRLSNVIVDRTPEERSLQTPAVVGDLCPTCAERYVEIQLGYDED